jgi:hypothetical protein
MHHISSINISDILAKPEITAQKELEIHPDSHPPTLNEVQLRACRIHFEHGGVCGGYTLDDWLEAEHELADENQPSDKKEHVH